jgi:hypothetical protein
VSIFSPPDSAGVAFCYFAFGRQPSDSWGLNGNTADCNCERSFVGPAIVAYRHPHAYRTLYILIAGLTTVLFTGCAIWDMGGTRMFSTLYTYVDREKMDAAKSAADAFSILNWKWIVGWMCLNAYLGFLDCLPALGIVAPGATKEAAPGSETSRAP